MTRLPVGKPTLRSLCSTPTLRALCSATAISALLTAPALAQSVFELDEIVFSGNLTELEADRSGVTVEVITAEDLAEAGDVELADFLNTLPGLSVSRNGPAGTVTTVRIRGLSSRYVAVRINGIDMTDPSQPQTAFEFGGLNTANISRIEVLYGSHSALYGSEAIGGVINIETVRVPDEIGTEVTVGVEAGSYETYSANVGIGTRFDRGTLSFSAARLTTDGFSAADENDGNPENDAHNSTTFTFGGTYDVTETLTVGLDGFFQTSSTDFDNGFPIEDAGNFSTLDRHGVRAYATLQTGILSHELSLSASDTERDGTFGLFEGDRVEARYLASTEFSDGSAISFGLEQSDESYASGGNGGESTVQSIFADGTWAATADLDISASLRIDDHSRFGVQPTARLAAAWRPDDATVIRGSISQGVRAPSLFELFAPSFGNPNLDPEESLSLDLGVEREFGDLTLGVTAFWIEIENIIGFSSGTYNQVPGETRTQGLELTGDYQMSDQFNLFGNYTYTDTETANGNRLGRVPLHQYTLGARGEFAGDWSYSILGTGSIDTIERPGVALDDYFVVNATIGYEISDGIEAYLRMENLFDEQYQSALGYGTSDRAFYVGLRASF